MRTNPHKTIDKIAGVFVVSSRVCTAYLSKCASALAPHASAATILSIALVSHPLFAYSTMTCLKDLIPITERGVFQKSRRNVERPFFINEKYLVFPEAEGNRVTGFYIYADDRAWYFDSVRTGKSRLIRKISDLAYTSQTGVIELVAQPEGLETVSVFFLPGYNPHDDDQVGSEVLSASILPVVGALVPRASHVQTTYYDPKLATDEEIRTWMMVHSPGRKPAKLENVVVNRTLMNLVDSKKLDQAHLWAPLKQELQLRKAWVKNNNLDEDTFRRFGHVMETSCKEF